MNQRIKMALAILASLITWLTSFGKVWKRKPKLEAVVTRLSTFGHCDQVNLALQILLLSQKSFLWNILIIFLGLK